MLEGRELSDRTNQINALDGLRGLAVLIVFLGHTSAIGVSLLPFIDCSGVGTTGVYLFFVLSSFLLTYPFIRKGTSVKDKCFIINYAYRRFLRIYPLYISYLLLALVSTFIISRFLDPQQYSGIPYDLSLGDFLKQMLLLKDRGIEWSIIVEFRYYFILPFVALFFVFVLKKKLIPCLMITIILISACVYLWSEPDPTNNHRLGQYLPIFLMGSLLAVIQNSWLNHDLNTNRNLRIVVEISGLAAVCALIAMIPSVASFLSGSEVPHGYFHDHYVLYGFLWSLLLFAAMNGYGFLKIIFENRFLRYVGFISFSIYLFHLTVIRVIVYTGISISARGWLMLIATIGFSSLTWALIEKPSSKFKLALSAPSK
ncbi:MAG: acyltransferase [Bacteroidales bacterium]